MTEPTPAPEQTDAAPAAPAQDSKPEPDWKAEARKWEARAKENVEAAKRLADLENAQKTDQQRLTERAETAEKERDASRTEAMRLRIASEKGLTAKQAARLRGSSEEELLADADELLEDLGSNGPRRPVGDVGQGARSQTSEVQDPKTLADAVMARRGH